MPRTMTVKLETEINETMEVGFTTTQAKYLKRELVAEREVSAKAIEACFVVKQFLERLEINTEGDDPLFGLRARVHAALDRAIDAYGATL